MKLSKIILFGCFAMLFLSCEERKFEFTVRKTINKTYSFDEFTENFQECVVLTRADILDELDIPQNATISKVKLSSSPRPRVRVIPQAGNQASAIFLSGNVTSSDGAFASRLWEKQDIPVPLVGVDIAWIGLNSLIEDGISSIANKVEKYILGLDTGSGLIICATAIPTPEGADVKFNVDLSLTFDIEYYDCISVFAPAMGGESCN